MTADITTWSDLELVSTPVGTIRRGLVLSRNPHYELRWQLHRRSGPEVASTYVVDLGDDHLEIVRFTVQEEFRSQQVGRTLAKLLIGACQDHGIATLSLYSLPIRTDFWKRLGFVSTGGNPNDRGWLPFEIILSTLPRTSAPLSPPEPA